MSSGAFLCGFLGWAVLVPSLLAGAAEPLSDAAVVPKTEGSIGVAPFERAGAAREALPDVAALLARRLSTRGVERVVGPAQLSAKALADPSPDEVVDWASVAGVETVVVGRTTRIGSRLSVDARLRGAGDGERLGRPFYAEIAREADLANAVDDLAGEVLERLAAVRPPPPVDVSAPGPGAGARSEAREAAPASERDGAFRRDQPIEIQSDELEALTQGTSKRFLFTGNVRAVQGELSLRSDRLEAFYPEGGSQPDRLVATGDVRIRDGARRATCDRATLQRSGDRVVCSGNARIDEGCDRVSGREIVFFLDREVLKVNGSADVRIHPRDAACEARAEARP